MKCEKQIELYRPCVLGDWVLSNTNANPIKTPSSVVAVNQDDPTKLLRLNPWGTTLPEGTPLSETVGNFGVDPKNNMISSTAPGSLPNVGYGGRLYMMGNDGSIFIYQVMPATNSTATGSP